MDTKLLSRILKVMRDQGCLKLKTPELELELVPEALLPKESQPSQADSLPNPPQLTEEEIERMVFYSAPSPEQA